MEEEEKGRGGEGKRRRREEEEKGRGGEGKRRGRGEERKRRRREEERKSKDLPFNVQLPRYGDGDEIYQDQQ